MFVNRMACGQCFDAGSMVVAVPVRAGVDFLEPELRGPDPQWSKASSCYR